MATRWTGSPHRDDESNQIVSPSCEVRIRYYLPSLVYEKVEDTLTVAYRIGLDKCFEGAAVDKAEPGGNSCPVVIALLFTNLHQL